MVADEVLHPKPYGNITAVKEGMWSQLTDVKPTYL